MRPKYYTWRSVKHQAGDAVYIRTEGHGCPVWACWRGSIEETETGVKFNAEDLDFLLEIDRRTARALALDASMSNSKA